MQDRNRSEPEECRLQQELSNKADFSHRSRPVAEPAKIYCRTGVYERRWNALLAVRPALFPICRKQKPGKNVGRLKTGLSLEMANKLKRRDAGFGRKISPRTL